VIYVLDCMVSYLQLARQMNLITVKTQILGTVVTNRTKNVTECVLQIGLCFPYNILNS